MADRFEAGDAVHVASFGKGIVREARNGGRYLVEVKGASMVVAASALTVLPDAKRGTRATAGRAAGPEPGERAAPSTSAVPSSLDLHGRTVAEAVALVDAFLNDAMLAGHAAVRIIHGISGGRVRAAAHGRLRLCPTVRGFRIDPSNPGVTIVSL